MVKLLVNWLAVIAAVLFVAWNDAAQCAIAGAVMVGAFAITYEAAKHGSTVFFRWYGLALVGIVVTLFAVVFAPVLGLFGMSGAYPRWLAWMQTNDNPSVGDESFHRNEMGWAAWMTPPLFAYVCAVAWQLRNPAYGYDTWAGLAIDTRELVYEFLVIGNDDVNIGYANGVATVTAGTLERYLMNGDGKHYFEFTWLYRWPIVPRAWRITIGWHLHQLADAKNGSTRNLKLTVQPWMAA
jgi:hypothetical protein